MIGYVRRLPGPVWTMLLWCTLYAINRTSGGFHSAGQLRDWLPEVAFELTIIAVLLAWGAKAPMWFLKAVVFAQLAVSFAILLLADDPVRELAVATGSILAVLYAGIWLRGRLTYIVAAAASASYLVAIIWGGMLESLADTWFGLTAILFGVSFILNIVVGQVSHDASHDVLTGLLNRIGLDSYIELHPRPGRSTLPRSLVVIDLDGFKAINDTQGHAAGDRLLRAITAAWATGLRSDDIAVRIGGDEFLLILPQTDLASAEQLVGRLRDVSPISWSCGITSWLADETFDEALVRADRLMYKDKEHRGGAS